jgi:hypothetical protein
MNCLPCPYTWSDNYHVCYLSADDNFLPLIAQLKGIEAGGGRDSLKVEG